MNSSASSTLALVVAFAAAVCCIPNTSNAQVIYSVSGSTNFGSNTANAGSGPTWTDSDSDGIYVLSHASDSGNNNAIFIDSSDGGTVNDLTMAALGRGLLATDTLVLTGSVSPASEFYDSVANGFEMGLASSPGFRANPNLIMQLRSTNQPSGTAAFFDYAGNTGVNSRNGAISALAEASLNDGFSYTVTYTAADITLEVTDVEGVVDGATSLSYVFTHGVDETSSGATTGFDFLTDVGNSYAYYSQQKWSAGLPDQAMAVTSFQMELVEEVPEPASLSLLVIALGAAGLLRRRRRSS